MTTNIHQLFVSVESIARASKAERPNEGAGLSIERTHHHIKQIQSTPAPTESGKNGARKRLYRVSDILPVLQVLSASKWTSAATLFLIEKEAATLQQHEENVALAAEMEKSK